MTDRVGQQFGNYHLIRLLGHGGFADVYLGEHIHLNTLAAIKMLDTRLAGDEIAQFRNEARTIARLEHPHIVRVLDFGVEDRTPFLVMSYAPNGTLRQRHPKGTRLLPGDVLSYIKQVTDALQYAHNEKLIHRDIKPENMLLDRNNEILLDTRQAPSGKRSVRAGCGGVRMALRHTSLPGLLRGSGNSTCAQPTAATPRVRSKHLTCSRSGSAQGACQRPPPAVCLCPGFCHRFRASLPGNTTTRRNTSPWSCFASTFIFIYVCDRHTTRGKFFVH